MSSAPFIFLSPALPAELLTYILSYHTYPTTLIVCASRSDFLASLADEARREVEAGVPSPPAAGGVDPQQVPEEATDSRTEQRLGRHRLASAPLHQVATSRHLRVAFVPTVTHLRAYLAVFSPDASKVPPPPSAPQEQPRQLPGRWPAPPRLVLYGFLALHHDTSEWSAQGLADSAAVAVELGHRMSWKVVLVEPRRPATAPAPAFEDVLREAVPILGGGGRRAGLGSEEGRWAGRTVEVGRVMKRWFRFQRGPWDDEPKKEE
ncbi:hypothetical protein GGS23DRAFT_284996 [Durotheca rogersii]|uniref:uncharacterized protein n=1 Tax=Durotheca rogersii TaxID=419775 RepID=UPI00221E4A3A|nr:uncharacterized protein GGS23DRAFT_284996 [Durotheca rogersii]KAI5866731.1 hypothetical protein GGS23DRAFT_284996 [Durotheca rogersii]